MHIQSIWLANTYLVTCDHRAYDPAEFDHLPVAKELKELFQHIRRYTPQNIELDLKLKPFIPEYIPAIGDIDAFIKVRMYVQCNSCVYMHIPYWEAYWLGGK